MTHRVGGDIEVGEAAAAARVAQRRLFGFSWALPVYLAFTMGCVAVAMQAAGAIDDAGGGSWVWLVAPIIGGAVGIFGGRRIWFALTVRHNRKRMAERGVTSPVPVAIELGDDGVRADLAHTTRLFRWPGVEEVFPVKTYWVIASQGEVIYVPKRFFASEPEERAFLAALWERLPDAARGRSGELGAWLGPDMKGGGRLA